MEDSIEIYVPLKENLDYSGQPMEGTRNFTSSLLKKTKSNLRKNNVEEVYEMLTSDMRGNLKKEKGKKLSTKGKRFIQWLTSAASNSRSRTISSSSASNFKSMIKSAPKTSELTAQTHLTPNHLNESRTKMFTSGSTSKNRLFSSSDPKTSEPKVPPTDDVQLIPQHLNELKTKGCPSESRRMKGSFSSKLPLGNKQLLAKRKIDFLSGRAGFTLMEEEDSNSYNEEVKNELEFLNESFKQISLLSKIYSKDEEVKNELELLNESFKQISLLSKIYSKDEEVRNELEFLNESFKEISLLSKIYSS